MQAPTKASETTTKGVAALLNSSLVLTAITQMPKPLNWIVPVVLVAVGTFVNWATHRPPKQTP